MPKIKGGTYLDTRPDFDLMTYFEGDLKAHGVIQDFFGNITSRFHATLKGKVEDDLLTLDETFHFIEKDGAITPNHRRWKIKESPAPKTKKKNKNAPLKTYTGKAEDIIGTAIGRGYGNALQWQYQMDVPYKPNKTIRLTFDDWIWALTDTTIMNRSYLKKFGLTVAELTLVIEKKK